MPSAPFMTGLFFCLFDLSCVSCSYILEVNPCQLRYLQRFSPSWWVVFSFCYGFLSCAKAFRFEYVLFVFKAVPFGGSSYGAGSKGWGA